MDATWESIIRSFDELSVVTVAAGVNFTGLLAILNGRSGPPKLCIDGHEYHRRQRRRTKRKRR